MNTLHYKELFKFITLFIIFLVIFIASRIIFKLDIIFYEGIFIILCITLVSLLFKFFKHIHTYITFFLFCYAFHITIPSLLDRSISLYILGLLHEEKIVTLPELQNYYVSGFVFYNGAIEKRLNEQVRSGNINLVNGNYSLTKKGERLFYINQGLASIFNTNKNYTKPIGYRDNKKH
jgi:hypothetical protein